MVSIYFYKISFYFKNVQVYLTNQGPSRGKDSIIHDSMIYTVIKMNNSMIKNN